VPINYPINCPTIYPTNYPTIYHGRRFRPVDKTENSETSAETIFLYQQPGQVVTAAYAGGAILTGHLIGLVDGEGPIQYLGPRDE
jgi:hypothetical protein